ncbi:hypothetical protein BH11MYX4_BH11MYX4_17460 [soil metagenome]
MEERDACMKELVALRHDTEALEQQLRLRGDPEDLTRQRKRATSA